METMTFDEYFGWVPARLLRLFKEANVSPSDWDSMLTRWGFEWGTKDLPWAPIEDHVTSHMVNGTYRYPMYS